MESGHATNESHLKTPEVPEGTDELSNEENQNIPRLLNVTTSSPGMSAITVPQNTLWMSNALSRTTDISSKGDGSSTNVKTEIMASRNVGAELPLMLLPSLSTNENINMDKSLEHVMIPSDDSHLNVASSQGTFRISKEKVNIELLTLDDGIMLNKYEYNDMFGVLLVKYPFKIWSELGKDLDMYATTVPNPQQEYTPSLTSRSHLGPMVMDIKSSTGVLNNNEIMADVISNTKSGYINVKELVITNNQRYANDNIMSFGLKMACQKYGYNDNLLLCSLAMSKLVELHGKKDYKAQLSSSCQKKQGN